MGDEERDARRLIEVAAVQMLREALASRHTRHGRLSDKALAQARFALALIRAGREEAPRG